MPRGQMQDTWTWLEHSSDTNKGRALSWNAAPEWRSCFSQLSHTTHLNTINPNQGYTEAPCQHQPWAQADNPGVGSMLKGLTTERTRWKKKKKCNWPVLCPICHLFPNIAGKRTAEISFRWDSRCQDQERRKQQVETVFVIQVHIPLVAARDTVSLTEVSWWRYQLCSLGWPECILAVMIWCLNPSVGLKSITEVHLTSGFKFTTFYYWTRLCLNVSQSLLGSALPEQNATGQI